MDFQLTRDQELIRDTVREFCERSVRPRMRDMDKSNEYPRDLVRGMAELGLMGMTVPEEWGGAGTDYVSFGLAAEEITRASAALSTIFGANNSLTCGPISTWGTDAQKEAFLRPLAQGKHQGAYALTEPQAGSDAASLRTSYRFEGDEAVLDGQKVFITCGSVADTIIVFATKDPKLGHKGVSAFIVPKGTRGLTVGQDFEKMGLHGSPTSQLLFEDCRIPRENLLGAEGEGFKMALATLDTGRILAAAGSVGLARGAFEDSLAYAKERRTMGKPILEHEAILFMLAEMKTNIEAGRLMYLKAAHLRDQDRPITMEASLAKVWCSEMAMDATTKGIQIHGGNGYITEYAVERYFRDTKIFEIFEGTSEVQRLVIARHLGV